MEESHLIEKKNYETMYCIVLNELMKKYPYSKKLYIDMTKEEYAEYLALSWCRKLEELMKRSEVL